MGKNGVNSLLNLAHLNELVSNPPPANLVKEFDFSQVSAINQALEEIYGARYARGLALRAGRATFDEVLKYIGAMGGMSDPLFQAMQPQVKLKIGLIAMTRIFSQVSDLVSTVEEKADELIFTVQRCPSCWERQGVTVPVCSMITGQLQAGLKWASGGIEFVINEAHCIAKGDSVCDFTIEKTPRI